MLTVSEQISIRPRLEALTVDELIECWRLCGIEFAPGHPPESFKNLDTEFLIGPLFADASYDQLSQAIDAVKSSQSVHHDK